MFECVLGRPLVPPGSNLADLIRQLYGLAMGALHKYLAGIDEANE